MLLNYFMYFNNLEVGDILEKKNFLLMEILDKYMIKCLYMCIVVNSRNKGKDKCYLLKYCYLIEIER